MLRDIKLLLEEVEKNVGKKIDIASDFEKLSKTFQKKQLQLKPNSLKKAWGHLAGKEKPSKETLDKIALFVGFQSWEDFRGALHGKDDGQTNYEV